MKIRLTENQYRRLLLEHKTSEELIDYDGGVHKKMGKKIDKFLSKLFIHIFETDKITPQKMEGPYEDGYRSLKKVISKVGGYNRHSSLILAHNYIKYFDLIKNGDVENLIGKPLEYYALFKVDVPLYYTGQVTGKGYGSIEGYSTSPDKFFEKIEQGQYDINDVDVNPEWDGDVYWELDSDTTRDQIFNDFDKIIDKEEITW
jgi:hypothetical protein